MGDKLPHDTTVPHHIRVTRRHHTLLRWTRDQIFTSCIPYSNPGGMSHLAVRTGGTATSVNDKTPLVMSLLRKKSVPGKAIFIFKKKKGQSSSLIEIVRYPEIGIDIAGFSKPLIPLPVSMTCKVYGIKLVIYFDRELDQKIVLTLILPW